MGWKRHLVLLSGFLAMSMSAFADTVFLKNGTEVEGTVTEDNAHTVSIRTASGATRSFRRSDVDTVVYARNLPKQVKELPPAATAETSKPVAPAAPEREDRDRVLLRRDLDHAPGRHLIVPAPRARRREDEVRGARRPVGVELAVDHVEVARARGLEAQPHAVALAQPRVGRDAFREPLARGRRSGASGS